LFHPAHSLVPMQSELAIDLAALQCLDGALDNAQFSEMLDWLASDPAITGHTPDQTCQLDPRDGSLVVYSTARSGRSSDTIPPPEEHGGQSCPICQGKVTRILDLAPLSRGFTFISQNLFPILNPAPRLADELLARAIYPDPDHCGRVAYGMHLLQWTSSCHASDWHNMPVKDLKVVLNRLARLEKRLTRGATGYMPSMDTSNNFFGSFSIIKNWGSPAGASLSHGHQQVAFSNIMPQRAFNNWSFHRRHKRTFSRFMLTENPVELTVTESSQWRLIVPYFMQRPLSLMLLHRGAGIQHLYELDEAGITELGAMMQQATRMLMELIPAYGRPPAFNFAIHNGPDNEVYVEFFPVTQTTGGFERLGLWICQEKPQRACSRLQEALHKLCPIED
jgi:galactose-1-phosphate uridylyltransferase